MNTRTLAVLRGVALCSAFGCLAQNVMADSEDLISKSFTVGSGGKLTMQVDRGSIDIKTGKTDKIEVEVRRKIRGSSEGKDDEVIKDHTVTFTPSGKDLTIESKNPSNNSWWNRASSKLSVQYTLVIPQEYNLDLKTSGGNITVENLKGEAVVKTSGGSIKLGEIDGVVNGKTSGGNITVQGCKNKIDVTTSGGSINLGEIDGDVTAKTSGGNVKLEKAKGKLYVRTSGGSIKINEVTGTLDAATSGGNVSASFSTVPDGDCNLSTSGGSIEVLVPANAALDLDAKTSGGRVSSDLAENPDKKQKAELKAQLNGGGHAMVLRTSGGNVKVNKI